MEINALTSLIETRELGGYTLPDELLDAHHTYQRLRQTTIDQPTPPDLEAIAARVVSAVAAGEEPRLPNAGRLFEDGDRDRRTADRAAEILRAAVDQAANTAALVCADLTERIYADHLRPAYAELHDKVREVASALDGYGLDAHQVIKAPAKVRTAYLQLPALADSRGAILEARRVVNSIGHHTPQHDEANLFASFRKPLAFFPGWRLPARIPMLPFPEDRIERLLWVVSPEAQAAEPWLPTIAEQDAAWLAQFEESAPKAAPWSRVVANACARARGVNVTRRRTRPRSKAARVE